MRKFIWLISIISMFGLASCESDSSTEAKELLARILNIVGIPHNIVLNICQDDNNNGFCELTELQSKITIHQGDSIDDIWEKVSLDENSSYLLAHHDPTKKILMELQDAENVDYDDGKFLFTYNPMSRELSILQMMVDAGYLQENQTIAIKQLERLEDQEKFYAILLKDLETNLNTLRAEGLTAVQAMRGNVREMADELIIKGIADTLPQNINSCNGDDICVDKELGVLSDELLIDENESKIIKEAEIKVKNFTKEMIQNRVVYYHSYTGEGYDNPYRKMSFSETSVLMQDIIVFEDGREEDPDEGAIFAFTLEDGKVKIDLPPSKDDDGTEYEGRFFYWVLVGQDETTWSIKEEFDIGRDGTIEGFENRTLYFSKPDDYPAEL